MTPDEAEARAGRLSFLKHWYDQTKNPLYVWEAIALCLRYDDPPTVPEWCLSYLRDASFNIFELMRGRDFRPSAGKRHRKSDKLTGKQAIDLIPEALSLSRGQGSRNAFDRLTLDRRDQMDTVSLAVALDRDAAAAEIASRRSVSPDRVKRRIAKPAKHLSKLLKNF